MGQSFKKLDPRQQVKNPVIFVVYLSAPITTILCLYPIGISLWLNISVTIFLWLTLLFANFTEAVAEGRGEAQADSLKQAKKEVMTHKINDLEDVKEEDFIELQSSDLKRNDLVYVHAGEQAPADGGIIERAASMDESAITGRSAPIIRESGGDHSAVTGGATVVSGCLVTRVTSEDGQSSLDKMVAMVEGTQRGKTSNEIGLQTLLITLTTVFLTVSVTLVPFTDFSSQLFGKGEALSLVIMIALLICLASATIEVLIPSIGIAGMSRLTKEDIITMSGRAIKVAGGVDVLLLDKTGTTTLGDRQASDSLPIRGVDEEQLADAAQLSSLTDEIAEGRGIAILTKKHFNLWEREFQQPEVKFIDFSAKTRMSGVDYRGDMIYKGAADTMKEYVQSKGEDYPSEYDRIIDKIARAGGTPLVVVRNNRVMDVVYLKDIVRNGAKEKFADMRKMGIKTIMITRDNPLAAAAITVEAGVDDFLAEATPEGKMNLIREYQEKGHLVAMTGDGTNDAPALAQAGIAMAMNTRTQAAKEAGNMIDLDSSPTKLLRVTQIGKQLLMTRGVLATFSIANDIAKYFAVIPVLFYNIYPQLDRLNIMGLDSPLAAILSAVIYNVLVIVALVLLVLKDVRYQEKPAGQILSHNLLIYGLGGIIASFIFIKIIDLTLSLIIL